MRYGVTLSLLAFGIACGGTDSSTTVPDFTQLTIQSTGFTSTNGSGNIKVPNPGNVVFVNDDTVAHSIVSNTAGCASLNVGPIAPNSSSAKVPLTNPGPTNLVCSISDASNPSGAFSGTVTVLTTSDCPPPCH
jgi:hypothetical protein